MSGEHWARIPNTLVSPGRTFVEIAERPSWLPPLLALVVTAAVFIVLAMPRIDYAETFRAAAEGRGVAVDESVLETQITVMERFGWAFGLLGVLVFQPLGFLVIATLFFLAYRLLGSEMRFGVAFAVTLHALLPLGVAALASIPVVLGRASVTGEELQNGVLLSNLAALAGDEAPAWAVAALRCIDFFGLWVLALYWIGFRAATRLSAGKVAAVVIAFWTVWSALKIGWAAAAAAIGG